MRPKYAFTVLCRSVCFAAAMFAAIASVQTASAQEVAFSVNISGSEAMLLDPGDYALQHIDSWDSPLQRIIRNSRPFIEVRNESTSSALTQLTMSIGDTDFSFGDSVLGAPAVLGMTTPGIDFTSTLLDGGDRIRLDFANGSLAAGDVIRFQVDIDGDLPGAYVHPDYRQVMFDFGENDNSDNSRVTAVFEDADNDGDDEVLGVVFNDIPDSTLVYSQGAVRPYAVMEMVDRFEAEIPEPSTIALGLLIASGYGAVSMRRRLG